MECIACRPGLCNVASELGCVTVSSASSGSVVTAIVHPITTPPTEATKLCNADDAVRSSSAELVNVATVSQITDLKMEHNVSICVCVDL